MKIALVTSEVTPFSKTGGLADVCGALPAELEKAGHEVVVISPLYRGVRAHGPERAPFRLRVPVGRVVDAGVARLGRHWFIDHEPFYDREGLYGSAEGDYEDNAARFTLLARGAMELLGAIGFEPDVVQAHDWQAGLVPVYMRTIYADEFAQAKSVMTIHNLGYQGVFWHLDMPVFGLDWSLYNWRQLEFYGKVNLLKGGIVFADAITTVSPTYAKEIQTKAFGCGLEGVLAERADRLSGILNGIDMAEWDPSADPHLPATFSSKDPAGKAACKKALQARMKLPPRDDAPVIGFVGRLVEQKGVDLLVRAAEFLAQLDLQVAILGSGEARFQGPLQRLGALYGEKLSVEIAFDAALAHLIEAGSDFFVMPSRYEPCGLTQMHSLRYGAVPIVRRTGGLADTVEDGKTGIVFENYSSDALVEAVERALSLWAKPKDYAKVQRAGMKVDSGWPQRAAEYVELFERITGAGSRRRRKG
jgi:starch synthase